MKSVLIIDTPKNCGDCPCAGEEFGICQADEKNRDCDWYKIPSWCPIKPMPKKKMPYGSDIFNDYVRGWNEYAEELEK